MITPRFKLEQNDHFVTITLHTPFSRVSDAEVFMEEKEFRFFSSPYYIRLHLPGAIVENDEAKAWFEADKNDFIILCPKVNSGEHFHGLDMLTSLLEPKGKRYISGSKIEVVGESSGDNMDSDFDWFIEQTVAPDICSLSQAPHYGFGLKYSNLFLTLAEELQQVVDIKNPDTVPISERKDDRKKMEDIDFNPEHYLADLFQCEAINPLISQQWNFQDKDDWTEAERDVLKNLPNKDFLMNSDTFQSVCFGLVDILLAYCYDMRTTMLEHTVESAWTIAKLSATLSWFEVHSSLQEVVESFFRRSFCYPLYRNYKLSKQVFQDAKDILGMGRKCVIKCFIDVYNLFNNCEPRYLLNQLYIQDYCIWLQQLQDSTLASLSDALEKVDLDKEVMGFHLVDLERAAINLMCESDSDSDIEDKFSKMDINESKPPIDLLIAAEAARESSTETEDSELDSDDLSSEESD